MCLFTSWHTGDFLWTLDNRGACPARRSMCAGTVHVFAGVLSYLCVFTPVAQPQPAMTLGNETMDLKLMAWAGPWERQGAVRKPASHACFHKGSRILSEVQGLLSQLGESFPAKQEAVPESWPPGGHWCPGTSTSPAHSVRQREVLLQGASCPGLSALCHRVSY